MFIGEGLVIHAPHTGDVVKVVTYKSFTGRRHLGVAAHRLSAPWPDGDPPPS